MPPGLQSFIMYHSQYTIIQEPQICQRCFVTKLMGWWQCPFSKTNTVSHKNSSRSRYFQKTAVHSNIYPRQSAKHLINSYITRGFHMQSSRVLDLLGWGANSPVERQWSSCQALTWDPTFMCYFQDNSDSSKTMAMRTFSSEGLLSSTSVSSFPGPAWANGAGSET